ncbi:MAG TPA: serine hydrolase [Gemmatimonadales bacterium]|nr:serine hydrolase [Gemmatimonadales bacterium]
MHRTFLVALAACLALGAGPVSAQRTPSPRRDAALERELAELARGVRGTVGIYVRHLRTGATAEINADSVFPTASMVKVPILVGVFDAVEQGRLRWKDTLAYRDSLLYPGEDILGNLKDGAPITLDQVALLMMTMSDNTASLWLQHLAGTGTTINAWLEAHGFRHTRINSRTPGREENRTQFGWGQTSPREMAELLVRIREGRAVSPAADQEMYRLLTRPYWTGEGLSQLPPWVQVAVKNGAVDRSRSEVMLVNAPSGDYVVCVITKGQEDTSWVPDNEGFVLLRKVTAHLWRRFEPKHPFTPAPGASRFKP